VRELLAAFEDRLRVREGEPAVAAT
jgi:hypothetical protein